MIKCPCTRDCAERSAECRKTCEAFIEYDIERLEDYKRRKTLNDEADARIKMERRRQKKGCFLK